MFALVDKKDNSITKMFSGNKGVTIGDLQYPKTIFTLWSEAERNAINIYTVEVDDSKRKNPKWYINTNITYSFDGSKAKGVYGDATALAHADTLWTSQDKTDDKIPDGQDVGDVAVEGLKTIKKRAIDNECAGVLAPSDWMVVKATETGTTMDSGWKTWRASVRTKCNSMQTQIDNAANVDALAALFNYTEQGDGSFTRPLGEFPIKE